MTEVLAVPIHLDGYYQPSSSPRCRSPQPPYGGSPRTYESTVPRSQPESYSQFPSFKETPPAESSTSSSPGLSSLCSTQSSAVSSTASSVCFESRSSQSEAEEALFLPAYDYGSSFSPSELQGLHSKGDMGSPAALAPEPSPALSVLEVPELGPIPADDNFIRHEPSRHVDYLSHDWKEEDIWASWRYMVGKRKAYNNSARLENASWRTWGKAKYNLKTISPDALNWLKDCDVTWLYGPLSTGKETVSLSASPSSPTASPTEAKLPPSNSFCKTRPILKKRSMSEIMLQRSLSTSSLLKQAAAAIESQQSTIRLPSRPPMPARANSTLASFPGSTNNGSTVDTSDAPSALSTGCQSPLSTKHIHFNDRVLQCIAVDKDDYDGFRDDDAGNSSSDDDGIIMMSGYRSSRRNSDQNNTTEPQTIAMLPSTTLKYIEEPEIRKSKPFPSISSFFSDERPLTDASATTGDAPPLASTSYVLEEDDEDLADIDWEPNGAFAQRRDSITVSRTRFGNGDVRTSPDEEEFQLPRYSYDDEEDISTSGLLGRAVDAVNTARDIAHVLWNVGWRR